MCRSRRELSNEYLLAKIGVDTAENEPLQVCPLSAYRSPRYMHNLPMFVHHLEGRVVIFAEIAAPFLMLVPVRCFRLLAAAVCIGMQVADGIH